MTKNDIVNLEITSLTSEGSGVGRHDGMAVFVPFTAGGAVIPFAKKDVPQHALMFFLAVNRNMPFVYIFRYKPRNFSEDIGLEQAALNPDNAVTSRRKKSAVSATFTACELCLCIVARKKIPEFSGLAESVTKNFPQITGVVLNINSEKTNVILGDKEIVLKGRAEIYDTMCGMNVAISPKSFFFLATIQRHISSL